MAAPYLVPEISLSKENTKHLEACSCLPKLLSTTKCECPTFCAVCNHFINNTKKIIRPQTHLNVNNDRRHQHQPHQHHKQPQSVSKTFSNESLKPIYTNYLNRDFDDKIPSEFIKRIQKTKINSLYNKHQQQQKVDDKEKKVNNNLINDRKSFIDKSRINSGRWSASHSDGGINSVDSYFLEIEAARKKLTKLSAYTRKLPMLPSETNLKTTTTTVNGTTRNSSNIHHHLHHHHHHHQQLQQQINNNNDDKMPITQFNYDNNDVKRKEINADFKRSRHLSDSDNCAIVNIAATATSASAVAVAAAPKRVREKSPNFSLILGEGDHFQGAKDFINGEIMYSNLIEPPNYTNNIDFDSITDDLIPFMGVGVDVDVDVDASNKKLVSEEIFDSEVLINESASKDFASSSPSYAVGDTLEKITLDDKPDTKSKDISSRNYLKDGKSKNKEESKQSGSPSDIIIKSILDSEPLLRTIHRERLRQVHPSLRVSLFSHVPPYIKFVAHDFKDNKPLPKSIQKILKWKLSTITPIVVRQTVVNSGFRLVRRSADWGGTWGRHMKSICFKTLRENQKINHIPGTFQIGRKDRLWKNLYRFMTKFGKKEFGFIPRTYVLPQDAKLLKSAFDRVGGKSKWIIKPPASARGTGIKVIHKWAQIPKKVPLIVQKYISNPYLINGNKFDLRLYVLITSFNPLRIYLYDNGLVRFASVKYSDETSSLANRYIHLTNYSINKLSNNYAQNEDAEACEGHKWTIRSLWTYLEDNETINIKALWTNLIELVIKTMISGESVITQMAKANLNSRYSAYELFGVDVLLDENLKPWLLEVNISPSLHSSSPLDIAVKSPLVSDLLNIAGFHIPNMVNSDLAAKIQRKLGIKSNLLYDDRMYIVGLSSKEKNKHAYFSGVENRDDYLESIISDLTPDDVRHLIVYEDEKTQLGHFQKIFPTSETHSYFQYLEGNRYYNMLFDAWETRFHNNRDKGIQMLEERCQQQIHLDITDVEPRHALICAPESPARFSDASDSSSTSVKTDSESGKKFPKFFEAHKTSQIHC